MARDHFSQMNKNSSHRHDKPHDSEQFTKDFGAICGMLYSIVTLKAFFPKSPAPTMTDSPIIDGNGGDQEETKQTPIE
jgi:hypothetical protein